MPTIDIQAPNGDIIQFPRKNYGGPQDQTQSNASTSLPPGFVLDKQPNDNHGLPPGYVLDKQPNDTLPPGFVIEQSPKNQSYTGALRQGIANVASGIGNTLSDFGAPQAGGAASDVAKAAQPSGYESAYEGLMHPKPGDTKVLGYGIGYLPRLVAESAPAIATDVTVGGVGGVVGGALGSLIGPEGTVAGAAAGRALGSLGSYYLRNLGDRSEQAAENRTGDPTAKPNTTDKVIGAATVLPEALLQTLVAGRLLNRLPVTGTGLKGVTQALTSTGKTAAIEGGTAGAQSAIQQAGTSIQAPGGPSVDPRSLGAAILSGALTGPAMSAAKLGRDVTGAVRFRDMDGTLRDASAAVANRMVDKAGTVDELASPKTAYDAATDTRSDVLRELRTTAGSLRKSDALTPDADNAIARVTKGRPLSDDDFSAISDAVGGTSDGDALLGLAKQASVVNQLLDKGSYNKSRERFSGGATEAASNFIRRHLLLSGGLLGAAEMTSAASSLPNVALPAAAGYAATRLAENRLGLTSPARSFVEKFADPSVPVRPADILAGAQAGQQARTAIRDALASSLGLSKSTLGSLRNIYGDQVIDEQLRQAAQKASQASQPQPQGPAATTQPEAPSGPVLSPLLAETAQKAQGSASNEAPRADTYTSLPDADVAKQATQDAVDAGVIPDNTTARSRYSQGVIRKRTAIRSAVHDAGENFTDDDVEAFQPYLRRLLVARTRSEALSIVNDVLPRLTPEAAQAVRTRLGDRFAAQVWKNK